MTELIIAFIAVAIVSFVWGWKARERAAVRVLAQVLEQEEKRLDANMIGIRIEVHPEGYFVYQHDNGSFMLKVEAVEDVEPQLRERFPGKDFQLMAYKDDTV